ncbi:MAG TPA: DUF4136 domain-containing protein [Steroidobacteraceae bacterium]|jgi:hypothetical protein
MVKKLFNACGVAVLAACALSACTTLRVTSDVNTPLIGTVQCHTFAWAGSFHGSSDTLRSTVANPVNESRLRAAIEANLRTVGVQPAPGVDPGTGQPPPSGNATGADCLVGYGIGMRNVIEGDPYGYGYGWGWGWGGRPGFVGGGWGWDYPYVYHEGIIAVDLYDARTRQPLWHASVNQNLSGATGEKADQKIQAAVATIFTKYPH